MASQKMFSRKKPQRICETIFLEYQLTSEEKKFCGAEKTGPHRYSKASPENGLSLGEKLHRRASNLTTASVQVTKQNNSWIECRM